MHDTVDEIKKKLDIVEFLSSYITLKKAGRNFKAVCPFHSEKTPSFVVSPDRQIWRCFGSCNEGGDIFKFIMKWENITFFEAVQELAQKAGIKIQKTNLEDQIWKKKERLISMNQLAGEYFNYVLFNTDLGKNSLEYLQKRSVKSKLAEKFQLGYSPSSWDSLLRFLNRKSYTKEELLEGGLLVKSDGGRYYDRFRGRLMFPIKDARGNIIAFSGRSLDPSEKASKYINTPETSLYHKRESLYGIDLAREAIKKENNVYLVEGEFDVISPVSYGIENIVATKGTAVTREQLTLLKRYTSRITLALDSDTAGEEAVKKTLFEAEPLDLEIDVVAIDFAKDPDEAVQKDPIRFKKLLKQQIPVYDFILDYSMKKYSTDDPYAKKKVGEEIIPLIEKIQNAIVQSHYIKKTAELLTVSEQSVEQMMRKIARSRKQQQFKSRRSQKNTEENREITIQKYLLSLVFQNAEPYMLAKKIFQVISVEDFSLPVLTKIMQVFLDMEKQFVSGFNLEAFLESLPDELRSMADELYLFASIQIGFEELDTERLALEVKKFALKRRIAKELEESDTEKNNSEVLKKLTNELNAVEKKLVTV